MVAQNSTASGQSAPPGSAAGQQTAPAQNPPAQAPAANAPAQGSEQEAAPVPPAPNQPGDTVQVPQQGEAPAAQQGDVFVFKKEVDEVTLHATVVDDHNRLITNLAKSDFTVFEDGKPQKITSFRSEDIPVAMGIVIDNSGSMREKRPAVNAAAINLVQSSNPQDQVFVVNFNEEYFLDQDYTAKVPKLKDALERIEARGGTALYDAVVASADHLKKSGALEKKVLLVVTDGEDNASRESLEETVRRLEEKNGPTIYTIGLAPGGAFQAGAPGAPRNGRGYRWDCVLSQGPQRGAGDHLANRPRYPQSIHHPVQAQHAAERGRLSHGEGRGQCQGL